METSDDSMDVNVTVDGKVMKIQGKPITIICHDGDQNIKPVDDDVQEIGPQQTMDYARNVTPEQWARTKAQPEFMKLFRMVFPKIDLPEHPLQQHGSGVQHIVGLIALTVLAINDGKRPFWKYPESHLHPSAQVGLAEIMVYLTQGDGNG